jgi:hypothetical protein
VTKMPELDTMDEAAMRAFYETCGISKNTTDAAIKLRRRKKLVEEEKNPSRNAMPAT